MKAAAETLLPHAKAALVASGVVEADLPTTLSAMLKVIEEKGLKLHQIFGNGAKSVVASETNEADEAKAHRMEAFKLRNK